MQSCFCDGLAEDMQGLCISAFILKFVFADVLFKFIILAIVFFFCC